MRKVKFAIIGAGTVGLTSLSRIRRLTDDFVMIQDGPFGTTCARVGCMPSKALIHCATHFHNATNAENFGISGGEKLSVDHKFVMDRVRGFRDRFTGGIQSSSTETLKPEQLIKGRAKFIAKNQLEVNGEVIEAERIIIGTGSRPIIPAAWQEKAGDLIMTSDHIFEQETLPESVAVVGLGVIGLELGQALSRLGVKVYGFEAANTIGGLDAPQAAEKAIEIMSKEFPIYTGEMVDLERDGDKAVIKRGSEEFKVDKVLLSIGRRPNVDDMGLEVLGVELDKMGVPKVDPEVGQLGDLPVFIGGDAANFRPILHEAGDEGRIAVSNAISYPEVNRTERKVPLGITFSEPGLAFFGKRYSELDLAKTAVGEFHLERNNGRMIMMDEDFGIMLLYADKSSRKLIGGELVMSRAEHLASLFNWVISLDLTVDQILDLPFYHPVFEEAAESVLKSVRAELDK